jgi:hypothetical protein
MTLRNPARRPAVVLSMLAASTALLTACQRSVPSSVSPDADRAVARSDATSHAMIADPGPATRQAVGDPSDFDRNKAMDMAITREITTRLARDPQLGTLSIHVDTASGRVVLRGSAPDTGLRNHATELARVVDGVVGIDNELNVQPLP